MPEHFFMMNNTIEIEVQNYVRAARSGRRKIWGILARRKSHRILIGVMVSKDQTGSYRTQN